MELGYALSGTENCSADCCHLFAGPRQGSTTMLVVDIGFLREVRVHPCLMCMGLEV
jgi:hypothetical protein